MAWLKGEATVVPRGGILAEGAASLYGEGVLASASAISYKPEVIRLRVRGVAAKRLTARGVAAKRFTVR